MARRDQNEDRRRSARERLENRLSTERVEEILEEQAWPATEWPLEDDVNRDDYDIEIRADWKRLEWDDDLHQFDREKFEQIRDQHECLDYLEMQPTTRTDDAERIAHYDCTWTGEWEASDGLTHDVECDAMVDVRPRTEDSPME